MGTLTPLLENITKVGSLTPVSQKGNEIDVLTNIIQDIQIWGSPTPKFDSTPNRVKGKHIVSRFSYTHIEQLLRIDDPLKRTLYELECIKSTSKMS